MDIINSPVHVGTVADTVLQLNSCVHYKLAQWVRSQVLFIYYV